jgi:hypothetical protein
MAMRLGEDLATAEQERYAIRRLCVVARGTGMFKAMSDGVTAEGIVRRFGAFMVLSLLLLHQQLALVTRGEGALLIRKSRIFQTSC